MSENNQESKATAMLALARGSEQRSFVRSLLAGETPRNYSQTLSGRAKQYAGRYAASFWNLHKRLTKAGFSVVRTPGPRGGEWSATYRLEVL